MLLLEMVGGRIRMDPKTNNHSKVNSLEWIYRHLEKREELKIWIEEEGDATIVRKLAIVGLWCIQWHPIDRPSIKEVTQMLEGDGSHLNLSPNPFMATNTPKLNASPLSEDLDVILEIE
ncbi:hypothetical protein KY285_014224 [Solanum tuberosum]|nr:hypothetical protein KY285_014224 [Solanum tuberosum]